MLNTVISCIALYISNIIRVYDHVLSLRFVCGLMYSGGNGLNVVRGFTLGSFQIRAPKVRRPKVLSECWLPVMQDL